MSRVGSKSSFSRIVRGTALAACLTLALPVSAVAEVDPFDTGERSSLTVEQGASPESDDVLSDDPLDVDLVDLPPTMAVLGSRSFTYTASGERRYFNSNYSTPVTLTAAAGSTWWDAVCTDPSDSRYTVVNDYPRARAHWRMERSYARMYCGKAERQSEQPFSEAAFGIRHIRRHRSQFAKLAAYQGSTWGHWMHWALRWTMSEPGWRVVQSENRYCYEKAFYFEAPSGAQERRWVIVILGRTGVRMITAFPRSSDYCVGTRF